MPLLPWPNTMSFALQLIPVGVAASQRLSAAPPVIGILFSLWSAIEKKTIDDPSGEKTGSRTS